MPKIALTTFYTKNYQPLADITVEVMRQYCDKHGYHLNINVIEDNERYHFVKTKDTRKLLDEFDVVMGIEADCLLTNFNIKVEDFLDEENELYITTDFTNINFGVFIVKSSDPTKRLFDWINAQKDMFGDEQEIFEANRNIEKTKVVKHPCFNSIPYSPYYAPDFGKMHYKPGDEVYICKENEGHWMPGNFICHLPGKNMQDRITIFEDLKQHIIYG
ncbi:MAG: hypothetical protein V4538_15120 [Bacteroidota bacterium]